MPARTRSAAALGGVRAGACRRPCRFERGGRAIGLSSHGGRAGLGRREAGRGLIELLSGQRLNSTHINQVFFFLEGAQVCFCLLQILSHAVQTLKFELVSGHIKLLRE